MCKRTETSQTTPELTDVLTLGSGKEESMFRDESPLGNGSMEESHEFM